jgi:hypothetical protein
MQLNQYDSKKAKDQAKSFLEKSILTLSLLLNVNHENLDQDSKNPFDENLPQHNAFKCLIDEMISYKKLTQK